MSEHWTPEEQAAFSAWAITEFPNESSDGLISFGSAWKQGQKFSCQSPASIPEQVAQASGIAGLTPPPKTADDVVAFIGNNYESMEDAGDIEDIRFQVSVHDLVSAFSFWFEDDLATQSAKEFTQQAAKAETAEQAKVAFDDRHMGYEFPSKALRNGAFNEFSAGWKAARTAEQADVLPPTRGTDSQQDARDPNWLLSTMDGKDWADEFCRMNRAADHGTMLSWFCCAIMTGYDSGRRHEAEEQARTAGAAKGGETNAESSDLAPTTSTVSASGVLAAADDVRDAERYRVLRDTDFSDSSTAEMRDKPWAVYLDPKQPIPTMIACRGSDLDHMTDRAIRTAITAAQAATDKSED